MSSHNIKFFKSQKNEGGIKMIKRGAKLIVKTQFGSEQEIGRNWQIDVEGKLIIDVHENEIPFFVEGNTFVLLSNIVDRQIYQMTECQYAGSYGGSHTAGMFNKMIISFKVLSL